MNLPFKLASWLSLDDAAGRLSESFGDTITVKGLIQLALDGKIPLSWNVVREHACPVTPYCSFSSAADAYYGLSEDHEPNAERIEYEDNIYWVDHWAYRNRRNSDRNEDWAYFDWFPDYMDSPPVSTVTGLFRFDLEIRGTRTWMSEFLNSTRRYWPGNELCLLDHSGQIWSFLQTRDDGKSWDIMHNGPPHEEIVIQRVDIEDFEAKLLEQKLPQEKVCGSESSITPLNGPWPWGTYETPMLSYLKTTAEKWWVRYDPSDPTTAPTKDEVIGWLKTEHGLTQNKAEAIALILRPENLPAGPRR